MNERLHMERKCHSMHACVRVDGGGPRELGHAEVCVYDLKLRALCQLRIM